MSIYKINANLPVTTKIDLLSDMVLELEGLISQADFNKNEIVQVINDSGIDTKYLRNQSLGHTLATYTGWTHVSAETGYSIWKYSPTNYTYNSLNQLYFDDKLISNKLQASSETATTFDKVYLYNGDSGSSYIDDTTEAGTENGTEFSLMDSENDYFYCGLSTTFNGIKFEFQTRGSNYTLRVDYWNGASWVALTSTTNGLEDDTNNFASDGRIVWNTIGDWATKSVNSQTKYWIRISTTTDPVTVAKAYYVIPANSVISLLALSSSEILNEDWAWCSYGSAVYVTIRNAGDTAYEGDYYITSSSSTTNKQNFFISNHEISADYHDSSYDEVVTKTSSYDCTGSEGVILIDATAVSVIVTLPSATTNDGKRVTVKAINVAHSAIVDCVSGQTIDGAGIYTFSTNYKFITVVSNGSNWYIISN
jgi:hypothetical protein